MSPVPELIHCMMEVRDLAESTRFYEAALGFRVVDRHRYEGHSLVYLQSPESPIEIELIQPDAGPAGSVEAGRLWHLAFRVADLAAEHRRLAAAGFRVEPIAAYEANGRFMCDYFYLYDPDGHQIEILASYGRYAANSGGQG